MWLENQPLHWFFGSLVTLLAFLKFGTVESKSLYHCLEGNRMLS